MIDAATDDPDVPVEAEGMTTALSGVRRPGAASLMRARAVELFAPVRHRDFRLLWLSQLISELGDWAARIAITALVFDRTDSPLLSAVAFIASLLPWLGPGQLLATLADRYGRRIVMFVSDVARAVLFGLLFVPLPVAVVLVVAAVAGMASPPFLAARSAALAEVVPRSGLGAAVQLGAITLDTTSLLGYAFGGLLLTTAGPRWSLLLNALTFVVSAALVARLPRLVPGDGGTAPGNPAPGGTAPGGTAPGDPAPGGTAPGGARRSRSVLTSLGEAARDLTHSPVLVVFVALGTIAVAMATAIQSQVVAWVRIDAPHLSWLSGLVLAGATAFSLIVTVALGPGASVEQTLRRTALLVAVPSLAAAALFAVDTTATTAVAQIVIGALYAALSLANAVVSPRLVISRRAMSFALLMGLMTAVEAVAAPVAGLLVSAMGPSAAFGVLSLVTALVGLAGLVVRKRVARDDHDREGVAA